MTVIEPVSGRRQATSRTVGCNYQSIFVMVIVSVFLLGGISTRLAYLQIIEGSRNR